MRTGTIYHLAFVTAALATCIAGTSLLASESQDLMIESLFKKTHVYRTYLKDDAIKCEAKDGVVTLSGTVAEKSSKILAGDIVECLPGVVRVDNELGINAGGYNESGDTLIKRKVNLSLLFHNNINFNKTAVEVKDGIVTLKGEASNMAQKELAAEYAKDIEGVKDVKNDMTLAAVPEPAERTEEQKIDDASVTAQVKTALMTHLSTSTVRTKVETREGYVTLTGIAKNDAEKYLVTKLVTDIRGVTGVRNIMTVEEIKTK